MTRQTARIAIETTGLQVANIALLKVVAAQDTARICARDPMVDNDVPNLTRELLNTRTGQFRIHPKLHQLGAHPPKKHEQQEHRPAYPAVRRYAVGVVPVTCRNAAENELVSLKPSASAVSVID
jgi:hypothetical protein